MPNAKVCVAYNGAKNLALTGVLVAIFTFFLYFFVGCTQIYSIF